MTIELFWKDGRRETLALKTVTRVLQRPDRGEHVAFDLHTVADGAQVYVERGFIETYAAWAEFLRAHARV